MPPSTALAQPELDRFLADTIVPLRLACLDRDGSPHVLSLWYLWRDGAIWCATRPDAWVVSRLRADPRGRLGVAGGGPPFRGLRGQGRAGLLPEQGEALLGELVDRYLGGRDGRFAGWLLARSAGEMAIRILPARTSRWDYSRRMR